LIILLPISATYCFAQYGCRSAEDVMKMKNMTVVITTDLFGQEYTEFVKKAFENCWHFCPYRIVDGDKEWDAVKNDKNVVFFGSLSEADEKAHWFILRPSNGTFREAYALFPLSHHIYPDDKDLEKQYKTPNDLNRAVYVKLLPIVLMTMEHYLQDVINGKVI